MLSINWAEFGAGVGKQLIFGLGGLFFYYLIKKRRND
jgi:hypothetical protein